MIKLVDILTAKQQLFGLIPVQFSLRIPIAESHGVWDNVSQAAGGRVAFAEEKSLPPHKFVGVFRNGFAWTQGWDAAPQIPAFCVYVGTGYERLS